MKWLITGGCGFIGSSLIEFLRNEGGHNVRIIDNFSVGQPADLGDVSYNIISADSCTEVWSDAIEIVQADIRDGQAAQQVGVGADVIVHLAANTGVQPSITNPMLDCQTNVIGIVNFLESSRLNNVKKFVFASSGGTVIGDCVPPINEEMVPKPKSPYGASKSAGEGYCSAYHGTFGVDTVALRFGNVYGTGSGKKNSVVAKFLRRALNGEVLEIYGNGSQTRDFIFNGDLVRAIYNSATTDGVGGEVFQIASSYETSINELAEMMVPKMKKAGLVDVVVKNAAPLKGEIQRNFSDTSKAKKLLNWEPEVSLDDGLDITINWFMSTKSA